MRDFDDKRNYTGSLVSAPRFVAWCWAPAHGWIAVGSSDRLADAKEYAASRGAHGRVLRAGEGAPADVPGPAPLRPARREWSRGA